jgi:hypothetical protein
LLPFELCCYCSVQLLLRLYAHCAVFALITQLVAELSLIGTKLSG